MSSPRYVVIHVFEAAVVLRLLALLRGGLALLG
jgi:hypothetical protein